MRTATQALPREPRRAEPRGIAARGNSRAARGAVQLELFGTRPSRLPVRQPARPVALPAPMDPEAVLLRRLNRLTGGRLRSLALTDNRRTILSVRPGRGEAAPIALRIHRSFSDAPDAVLSAVAAFVESKKGSDRAREALSVIREHFSRHRRPRTPKAQRPALHPEGVTFDLRELRDEINRRHFEGRLAVAITWGKAGGSPAHRCRGRRARSTTVQLGSYSYEDKLIRVHRLLDQPRVPRYVVEAVVYHELLHAAIPPEIRNGRRHVHTPEFRRRERLFRDLDRAERWVERHLHDLVHGKPRK
ncbi:MAG TPA: hypothetical protein VOA87_21495 [Thermoanaerobaculia bacterium]|nr:hypothetical protein [Thermoanaerobaculia bacterium]